MLLSGDFGQLTAEQLDTIKNIDNTNERMISLVNSLLSVSRLESGRIMVEPKTINLREFVDNVLKDLTPTIMEKSIVTKVSLDPEINEVTVDPNLLRHVLNNLLSNSIKYNKMNGTIQLNIARQNNNYLCSIVDSGLGIPLHQQDQIFKKFFRADNAVRMIPDGNGLGLYLIKEIIGLLGGNIWFESQEGQGTTFWFSLPLGGTSKKAGELSIDAT
jgi:signal transduction histidine kinase